MDMDMNIPDEWKSLFPIFSVFNPPLLSSPKLKPILGPLIFGPKPYSTTLLFSSSSLLPHLPPLPRLSLRRLLLTSCNDPPPLPSGPLASFLGPHHPKTDVPSYFHHNCLQFLQCPQIQTIIIFFPCGENADQVGFFPLLLKDSTFDVKVDRDGGVFTSKRRLNYRISRISVNPVSGTFRGNGSPVTIGYLFASTLYSVEWFIVKVDSDSNSDTRVRVVHVGTKIFKTCRVVHACWSSHLLEESVVLLENGNLFLFDLESRLETHNSNGHPKFRGTRLKVVWGSDDGSGSSQNCRWLSCEFSWHPRVLIVARSDAVFLVDLRSSECNVSCLMKIELLHMYANIEKEQFLVLSRTSSDDFHFVLASDTLLLLCDVRKPLMPVLQWAHELDKPGYIDAFRLSELRSHSRDDTSKWASDSGFCIIMGSFWNCQFSIFCYGPSEPAPIGTVALKIATDRKSFYAWELPSALLLSGRDCPCGSCLVREEFLKESLPEWIDWQQKKEIVLGFGIVNKDLSALLSEPDEFGGFTLIRLMSSGKLELQRYCASWDSIKMIEGSHVEVLHFKDYFLYELGDEGYKFTRRFKYHKYNYLYGYLKGNLEKALDAEIKKLGKNAQGEELFCPESHEFLCKKLHDCGFDQLTSNPAVTTVLKDTSMLVSIREVGLKKLWAELPVELLQLAFSYYSELLEVLLDKKRVSLEFSAVPDLSQLPPFILREPSNRSTRWSQKVRRGDNLVGPVLPLPVLLKLNEYRSGSPDSHEQSGNASVEADISRSCDEVMRAVGEQNVDDAPISLDTDGDGAWMGSQKSKPFLLYHPEAGRTPVDHTWGKNKDDKFVTLISKVSEKNHSSNDKKETIGLELVDDLCPVELSFDAGPQMELAGKELKAYGKFKGEFLKWQKSFGLYESFCSGI